MNVTELAVHDVEIASFFNELTSFCVLMLCFEMYERLLIKGEAFL